MYNMFEKPFIWQFQFPIQSITNINIQPLFIIHFVYFCFRTCSGYLFQKTFFLIYSILMVFIVKRRLENIGHRGFLQLNHTIIWVGNTVLSRLCIIQRFTFIRLQHLLLGLIQIFNQIVWIFTFVVDFNGISPNGDIMVLMVWFDGFRSTFDNERAICIYEFNIITIMLDVLTVNWIIFMLESRHVRIHILRCEILQVIPTFNLLNMFLIHAKFRFQN
jgi:hypothetical protein